MHYIEEEIKFYDVIHTGGYPIGETALGGRAGGRVATDTGRGSAEMPGEIEGGAKEITIKPVALAGVTVTIGDEPTARNLEKLLKLSNTNVPPEIAVLFEKHDVYAISHGIGVSRVSGRAKPHELLYYAGVFDCDNVHTIDLFPKTDFNERFRAGMDISGSIHASGAMSAELPQELKLLAKTIPLDAQMSIQLSADPSFVGKISFVLKYPVVISTGTNASYCSWVLNPKENPLLGDQLLVQTIAVPKGVTKIKYKAYCTLKVKSGFPPKELSNTSRKHTLEVELD